MRTAALALAVTILARPALVPAHPADGEGQKGVGVGETSVRVAAPTASEAAGSGPPTVTPNASAVADSAPAVTDATAARSPAPTVRIPDGSYVPHYALTGDPEPRVEIGAFALDATPVTVGQYLDFLKARPSWRRSRAPAVMAGPDYLASWVGDLEPGRSGAERRRPVTEVSWFAARAYCSWRGMRLPTTDEWEYAAGAGETEVDGFRDAAVNRRFLQLHLERPGPEELPPVGRTFRNAHGVWDLHGLVWEWTSDFNNQMLSGAGRDDQSLDRQLFCAAGSVGATDIENYAAFLRYAFRSSLTGDYSGRLLGFRCAASRSMERTTP